MAVTEVQDPVVQTRAHSGVGDDARLRVGLIGAGNVSGVHAEVVAELPEARLSGVCDTSLARARGLALRTATEHVFTSVEQVIESGLCDVAHVLVPPDAHLEIAEQLLDAGIAAFVEKPLGCSSEACRVLARRAKFDHVALGANHNAIFYPAHVELRRRLAERQLGALTHLVVLTSVPEMRHTPAGHWMLRRPENFVFEFGVHPLSQVLDLAGAPLRVQTLVSGPRGLPSGLEAFDTWQVSLMCADATAQVFLSYGGAHRTWIEVAICEDGLISADIESNTVIATSKTPWSAYLDLPLRASSRAGQELRYGAQSLMREVLTVMRSPRRDPYFVSMRDSVAAFHQAVRGEGQQPNGDFATCAVSLCEAVTEQVVARGNAPAGRSNAVRGPLLTSRPLQGAPRVRSAPARVDAVVLGGSGFIGRAVVQRMLDAGMTVRVMARNPSLPGTLPSAGVVQTFTGDVADANSLTRAIEGARFVVHLAHGGSFTWEDVEATMLRPARRIAQACLTGGVERLVYAGTIASLYLGDPADVITGDTRTDPHIDQRGPYEWGKAKSEEILHSSLRDDSLPVCIVRPGIVLGRGGNPFHSGFGVWRGDVHCIGWNLGRNPLPLVLVDDVATAIHLALERPVSVGGTYNLVGDVRLPARECVTQLGTHLGRPLVFHPRHPVQHELLGACKWLVKRATGHSARFPSLRAIRSMGCRAHFDSTDVKRDLGWVPLGDHNEFVERALHVYADRRSA